MGHRLSMPFHKVQSRALYVLVFVKQGTKSPEEALDAIAGFLAIPGMLLLLIPPDIVPVGWSWFAAIHSM